MEKNVPKYNCQGEYCCQTLSHSSFNKYPAKKKPLGVCVNGMQYHTPQKTNYNLPKEYVNNPDKKLLCNAIKNTDTYHRVCDNK